jgi:transcription antitermination protein NusB
MKARSAARELTLLTLFQTAGRSVAEDASLEQLILGAVRALVDDAREKIQSAVDTLVPVSEYIQLQELEHPSNLESGLDTAIHPVPIPTTRQMVEKIDQVLAAAEEIFEAFELPELLAHARTDEVRNYSTRLIRLITDHRQELDQWIEQFTSEWKVARLSRMDANILRIAAAEIRYVEGLDVGIAINEAVELAKKFSTEDSFRFINGVLGGMARSLNVVVKGLENAPTATSPEPSLGTGIFDHLINPPDEEDVLNPETSHIPGKY